MSSKFPLVGYKFCIIQGDVVAVTGDIVQGHGEDAYLVRFNTGAPYTRVLSAADPIFSQMNLFTCEDELGNFIEAFHKQLEPSAANDVVTEDGIVIDINGGAEPEDTDNPAVA